MTLLTVYGKPGCCLCDEAREVVAAVRRSREFELEEVDVSLDPVLNRRYGERIPVLALDGQEAFEFHVSAEALTQALDRVKR